MLLKFKANSQVEVNLNESRDQMLLSSQKKFKMMNENHIFQALGLTHTTEEELRSNFNDEIYQYLMNSMAVSQDADSMEAKQGNT